MYTQNLILLEILVVPRELKNNELFSQETYNSQNFRYETLKSPLLKTKCIPLTSFRVKVTDDIKGTFLSFSLITE